MSVLSILKTLGSAVLDRWQEKIDSKLENIQSRIMMLQEDFATLRSKIETAATQTGTGQPRSPTPHKPPSGGHARGIAAAGTIVTNLGARITDLKARLAQAGVDPTLLATMDGLSDTATIVAGHLQSTADALADPNKVVPVPPSPAPPAEVPTTAGP